MSTIRDKIKKKVLGGVASVVAATGLVGDSTIKSAIRGKIADMKRGNLLYKQGYGGKDWNWNIAKKGKSK